MCQIYLSKMPNEFRSPMDLFLVPSEKLPRLLTTSPSAMRRLLRKAELLGISTQVVCFVTFCYEIQNKNLTSCLCAIITYYCVYHLFMLNKQSSLTRWYVNKNPPNLCTILNFQVSANQKTDIRKKWHVAPAFSVDFISYYLGIISKKTVSHNFVFSSCSYIV